MRMVISHIWSLTGYFSYDSMNRLFAMKVLKDHIRAQI